ncbi:aldehyde dehydrogenase family protein [Granulicella tundricola]|nr:aldehyde dehydrogenase family protein [Granulicella tundricola]
MERSQVHVSDKASDEAWLVQALWSARPLRERLSVLRAGRLGLARKTDALVSAISTELARTRADSMVAEVLPLLAACRFLEREAGEILKTRRLGRRGLPFWLAGVESSVERVALGRVLVIGPENYPLFLPGVQVLQALAAGNAVVWKPGAGGRDVAEIFADVMERAGLPDGLLTVTDESVEAGVSAMRGGVDKVFFTGSGASGRAVMRAAAETATPVVAELSGCDAVIVLPSANVERVVAALLFGMRLNGSATCMAPRRLMLVGGGHERLVARLTDAFAAMDGVVVRDSVREQLRGLVEEAKSAGAVVHGDVRDVFMKPLLVTRARPEMQLAQTDVFAPVLTVMEFGDVGAMLEADRACPFGLTAAVFGDEVEATRVGARMKVGTLLINDLIVPTADPRVPFGGRRGSGFGVTRGAEGLLEMTAVKTVLVRRGKGLRQYVPTTDTHENLFGGVIEMEHGDGLRAKIKGLRRMIQAAMRLK